MAASSLNGKNSSRRAVGWSLGLLLLALGAAGWWLWSRGAEPPQVKAARAAPRTLREQVYTTGTVTPAIRQEVRSPAPSRVAKVPVKVGDKVKAGDILVQLDQTLAEVQVAQARAAVETAQANLEAAKASLAAGRSASAAAPAAGSGADRAAGSNAVAAKAHFAAAKAPAGVSAPVAVPERPGLENGLVTYDIPVVQAVADERAIAAISTGPDSGGSASGAASGAVSLDSQSSAVPGPGAGAGLEAVQAELAFKQGQAALRQAQEALRLAQVQRDQLTYNANLAGTVLEVNAQEGNPAPVQVPLLVLADLGSLKIRMDVNEVDAGKIRQGQPVQVTGKMLGSSAVQGTVQDVALQAVSQPGLQGSGTPTVAVTVALSQVPPELKPGFTVNAQIEVARRDLALAVPQEALFQDGKDNFVYRLVAGRLKKTKVQLGIADEVYQEVVAGLQTGDEVVLNPLPHYYDGMPASAAGGE